MQLYKKIISLSQTTWGPAKKKTPRGGTQHGCCFLPQHGCWNDICWTPSKPSVKTIEYQRHPNFPPVKAEKEGKWPDRQSRTGQKTTPVYPDAEYVMAISADKGYKTTRKPNQSPTVMNNIISKSSVCPYILEGCIVDLWNCYIGQKLTEKQD